MTLHMCTHEDSKLLHNTVEGLPYIHIHMRTTSGCGRLFYLLKYMIRSLTSHFNISMILPLLSARDLDIGPEGFSLRDDISRGMMTRAIWKRQCINLFITYFARTDNMLLPSTRGEVTCYCPSKMLLPRRQITRRKLCLYVIIYYK